MIKLSARRLAADPSVFWLSLRVGIFPSHAATSRILPAVRVRLNLETCNHLGAQSALIQSLSESVLRCYDPARLSRLAVINTMLSKLERLGVSAGKKRLKIKRPQLRLWQCDLLRLGAAHDCASLIQNRYKLFCLQQALGFLL